MTATLLLCAALTDADVPAIQVDTSVEDVTALMGTWEVVELTVDAADHTGNLRGNLWTFAGEDVTGAPAGPWGIAAGTARLDQVLESGHIIPGVYSITGGTLVWTQYGRLSVFRFTLRRVPK